MAPSTFAGFSPSLFKFLGQLEKNNRRDWFQENKARYESDVLQPSLEFIRSFAPLLKKISPHFVAADKRVGGSLMRVYRDTRFSKDKLPYKTNVGISFRHEHGKDIHAPGFYLHLAPKESFFCAGIWHPDSEALKSIRSAIDDHPSGWKRARDNKRFRACFELQGESLKSAPRGYDKQHPLLEDLKRKDHIAVHACSRKDVLDDRFIHDVAAGFATARPYLRFLCEALHVPF